MIDYGAESAICHYSTVLNAVVPIVI